jgi:glutaminyl-peptide cyclotransferase
LRTHLFIFIALIIISCGNQPAREPVKSEQTDSKDLVRDNSGSEASVENNITDTTKSLLNLKPGNYKIQVVRKYPHDDMAYTQGLVYLNGFLYEGTGIEGRSTLRKTDIVTGRILQKTDLPGVHFGEGIAVMGNYIYQLTWRTETCFVFNLNDFSLIKTFNYDGQGWGLTTDGKSLIMTNGSNEVLFIEPGSFSLERKLWVFDDGIAIINLNELEYIDGEIWANIYTESKIVRINPISGEVIGYIDISNLIKELPSSNHAEVLNGIAYDKAGGRIFLTGKLWPYMFIVQLTR